LAHWRGSTELRVRQEDCVCVCKGGTRMTYQPHDAFALRSSLYLPASMPVEYDKSEHTFEITLRYQGKDYTIISSARWISAPTHVLNWTMPMRRLHGHC